MLDDLMNAMLSGAGSESDEDKPDVDELANLLGGLLGGSADQGGGDAGDLLAGLLGGGGSQEAGDVGDLLSAVLGGQSSEGAGEMGALTILNAVMGGGADTGVSSMLAPVTDHLAKKLGVPPEMAQMIVTFAVSKLLSSQMRGGAAATRSGSTGQDDVELDDLVAHMNEGGLDADYLQSTGMVEELSQQTGLDSDTAARGLQEAFEMLGGQLGEGQ